MSQISGRRQVDITYTVLVRTFHSFQLSRNSKKHISFTDFSSCYISEHEMYALDIISEVLNNRAKAAKPQNDLNDARQHEPRACDNE